MLELIHVIWVAFYTWVKLQYVQGKLSHSYAMFYVWVKSELRFALTRHWLFWDYIIITVLYLTLVKVQINDKTIYKSHSLQLGLFTSSNFSWFLFYFKYTLRENLSFTQFSTRMAVWLLLTFFHMVTWLGSIHSIIMYQRVQMFEKCDSSKRQ